jgi:N-hydroxyarylamine O-acetyltransferase
MNGLFAWALRELGFEVRLLAGTVNRALRGDAAQGNHLVLLVELEQPFIADVGFGNGFLEPLPLAPGVYHQEFLSYTLVRNGVRWEFGNHAYGGPGYDFTLAPHRLDDFAGQCHALQTAADSSFVRSAVCHRHTPGGVVSLRGAVLTTVRAGGAETRTITSAGEYVALLAEQFGLDLPQTARLWLSIARRHQEWLREQAHLCQ